MPEYTKEQLWKMYESLPKELKEAIFSVETANDIRIICLKAGLEKERISEVAKLTGDVLLGILLPEDFQKELENQVKIEETLTQRLDRDINRLIFYPYKKFLDELQNKKVKPLEREAKEKNIPNIKTAKEEIKESTENQKTSLKQDTYRESID